MVYERNIHEPFDSARENYDVKIMGMARKPADNGDFDSTSSKHMSETGSSI